MNKVSELRKIPENVKKKALNMWLQGHSYREIDRKLGISIGAMSAIVWAARKQAPDLVTRVVNHKDCVATLRFYSYDLGA